MLLSTEFRIPLCAYKLKAYCYRFQTTHDPTCTFNVGNQTIDNILCTSSSLKVVREILSRDIKRKGGEWPESKT